MKNRNFFQSYPPPDSHVLDDVVESIETPFPPPYPPPYPNWVPTEPPQIPDPFLMYLPVVYKSFITYDRVRAVSWADQWAHDRPSCFPNY